MTETNPVIETPSQPQSIDLEIVRNNEEMKYDDGYEQKHRKAAAMRRNMRRKRKSNASSSVVTIFLTVLIASAAVTAFVISHLEVRNFSLQ